METERRRQLLLAAVAIVLALVAYQAWPRTSAGPVPSSNERRTPATRTPAAPAAAAASGQDASGAPDVHLEALDAAHPKPGPTDRNLFRFKAKAPPPPPPSSMKPMQPVPVAPPVPTGPLPPPPPPPITLKFIGFADPGGGKPKVAVLTDGVGPPFSAREGEIVAGRYRILKIGVESIELAYADGRGRQTIRLTGS